MEEANAKPSILISILIYLLKWALIPFLIALGIELLTRKSVKGEIRKYLIGILGVAISIYLVWYSPLSEGYSIFAKIGTQVFYCFILGATSDFMQTVLINPQIDAQRTPEERAQIQHDKYLKSKKIREKMDRDRIAENASDTCESCGDTLYDGYSESEKWKYDANLNARSGRDLKFCSDQCLNKYADRVLCIACGRYVGNNPMTCNQCGATICDDDCLYRHSC